jgi:hypothetical protein
MKNRIFSRLTNKYIQKFLILGSSIFLVLSAQSLSYAQEQTATQSASEAAAQAAKKKKMAEMQASLNQEVMDRPFLAEKPEEVDAYIKSMLEKNVKPPEYSGTYWRPGYTCRNLLRYDWTQYRNCRYYYRYYGRYY